MSETTERPRPAYKRDLLERAKGADGPVTDIDINDNWEEPVIRVHAIREVDGTAHRALICDGRGDGDPRVSFARCHWDADWKVLREWQSLATGRLSGPQRLPEWESLFAVFEAALDAYHEEIAEG